MLSIPHIYLEPRKSEPIAENKTKRRGQAFYKPDVSTGRIVMPIHRLLSNLRDEEVRAGLDVGILLNFIFRVMGGPVCVVDVSSMHPSPNTGRDNPRGD